jgi:hypothetical protein
MMVAIDGSFGCETTHILIMLGQGSGVGAEQKLTQLLTDFWATIHNILVVPTATTPICKNPSMHGNGFFIMS